MANKYVRTSSAGSANGNDWSNAWSMANLNSNWASVNAGDTVWLAGGSYSTGMNVTKSGSSGNPITIRRVLATDATPVAAAGWSSGFDAQVIVTANSPLDCNESYVVIDGRVDMGMRFTVNNTGGTPSSANMSDSVGCVLRYLDLVGPSCASATDGTSVGSTLATFSGDSSGVNCGYGGGGGSTDLTISHCRVRGHPNEFWMTDITNTIIEYCYIYDNGAANSGTYHGNVAIISGSDGFVFRYNTVYNWQAEGLYPWASNSTNWFIYGNVFRGGPVGDFDRALELRDYYSPVVHGPIYIYNNTFVDTYWSITQGDVDATWHSSSVARNNIFWNMTDGSAIQYSPPTVSHNLSDDSVSGTGSISSGTQSFVNYAGGDFHIVETVSATRPRNKGVTITNVSFNGETLRFDLDADGVTRGADGTWDMGAFEFEDEEEPPPEGDGTVTIGGAGTVTFGGAGTVSFA